MSDPTLDRVGDRAAQAVAITGGASGIGLATAEWLAREGVGTLVLLDVDEVQLATAAEHLSGHAAVITHALDVSDPEAWFGCVQALAEADCTALAGLVCAAGIADGRPVGELDAATWSRVIGVNLTGTALACHALLPLLQHTALSDGEASVVLVASAAAHKAAPGAPAYCASKAGLVHLARCLALEWADDRIRVNSVSPGGTRTPLWSRQTFFADLVAETGSEEAAYARMALDTPLHRFAEPVEIANAIAWLLAPGAGFVTGTDLRCDGGQAIA